MKRLIILALLFPTPSFAESCTTMMGTCLGSYTGMDQTGSMAKCSNAAAVCRVQCKKGQKVFIGPFNGAAHPVDTCN